MQAAANTSRFLTGCSSKVELADSEAMVSRGGLLRDIVARHLAETVHSQELFVKVTNDLIRLAERAFSLRDLNALEDVSHVLMNLPVDAARQIGTYYYAFTIHRKGHSDEAKTMLETVADNAPITYRARAIQTLGGIHHYLGQFDEAFRFQLEALRVASDRNANGLQTTLLARWEISIINSLDGDHERALSDLHRLSPLVNLVAKQNPFYFYAFRNALAVGLGELGHLAEARAALHVALASPYAPAYPEWTETGQELEAERTSATRSIVAMNCAPAAKPSPQARPQRKSKPVAKSQFNWPARIETSLRRASRTIAAAAIPNDETNGSILDQVLVCIAPRGPPLFS
jgi:tetratricopeptide (TPR) repeat protein